MCLYVMCRVCLYVMHRVLSVQFTPFYFEMLVCCAMLVSTNRVVDTVGGSIGGYVGGGVVIVFRMLVSTTNIGVLVVY